MSDASAPLVDSIAINHSAIAATSVTAEGKGFVSTPKGACALDAGQLHCTHKSLTHATGAERSEPFHDGWARAAASRGLVAILPDLPSGSEARDFAVLRNLRDHAAVGVDPEGIAVYAGSGNVSTALPLVRDPSQTTVEGR